MTFMELLLATYNPGALIQEMMEEHDLWQTCLNCRHFTEALEQCNLCVPPSRPPARVITFGCPAFEEVDSVPAAPVAHVAKPKLDDLDDDIPF